MFLCSGAGAAQPPSEGVLRGNEIKQGVWRGLSVPYMRFWPSRARVWFPAVAKVQDISADHSWAAPSAKCHLERPSAKFPGRAVGFSCCSACCLHLPSGTIRTAACSLTRVWMPRDADSPTSRHLLHCR